MFLIYITLLTITECKAKLKSKRNRNHNRNKGLSEGMYWLFGIICLVVIPPMIMFIYNVIKDPATPTLISNASDLMKEKTFGYLSKSKQKRHKKYKD
jgi:hypothetical protein